MRSLSEINIVSQEGNAIARIPSARFHPARLIIWWRGRSDALVKSLLRPLPSMVRYRTMNGMRLPDLLRVHRREKA